MLRFEEHGECQQPIERIWRRGVRLRPERGLGVHNDNNGYARGKALHEDFSVWGARERDAQPGGRRGNHGPSIARPKTRPLPVYELRVDLGEFRGNRHEDLD